MAGAGRAEAARGARADQRRHVRRRQVEELPDVPAERLSVGTGGGECPESGRRVSSVCVATVAAKVFKTLHISQRRKL